MRGAIINGTTTASYTFILLPVQEGPTNQCHSEGLKYVQVQLALDFADLNMVCPAPSTILRGEYYIQLPQRTVLLTNSNNIAYNLTTFNGAADLQTLSASDVRHDILEETHQDGPFDLLEPAFNLPSCKTDSTIVYNYLKTLVVRLASNTVHKQLFYVLVPGYSMEPQTVLDHIWQSYINENGGTIHLSAQVYYTTSLNAIQSFYNLKNILLTLQGSLWRILTPSTPKVFVPIIPPTARRATTWQSPSIVS